MKHLSRSPLLWIAATIASGFLYFFTFHFFPKTFPLIHLDIKMDLKQALKDADALAQKYNFGPAEYDNAATFHTDTIAKTFVELEGGGKDALVNMIEEKLYMPYTWQVRHFKEFEKNETLIIFTPEGQPYGFIETISENNPGAQLSKEQAHALVESDFIKEWNVDLSVYTLVEYSHKQQPSDRIDHTFVYERNDKKIGEGLYRLNIVVSGDKITAIINFVKAPEAFNHRYIEMYSANNTIAWIGILLMIILYCIIGCGFGLIWLMRTRWALYHQSFKWAFFIAFTTFLVSLNQLPSAWMLYPSALSSHGFLIQILLKYLMLFFANLALLTIVITTAESLTRKAFGHHPQLWLLWSTHNSASYAVLGRTVAGYLMVGFNCAFVIAFYLISARYLQWWTPSETLFDPNILATYVPWFSPIAQSLYAGFMEECLFRAIPLAGAALLGTYCGKKNWWIGAAFILQALIFGAAHANYATQPSYTRLIELFIPSLIWGATYLRWGLLPTIITHCVYDIIWFSLPIFISQAPQALTYKIIIILVTLFPLLYVLYAHIRQKRWSDFSPESTNAYWQPSEPAPEIIEPVTIKQPEPMTISSRRNIFVTMLGILGLIVWLYKTPFTHDGISITIDRNQAIQQSNEFLLQHKNFTANPPWKTLPLLFSHYTLVPLLNSQHKFIWQEGGKELYHSLLSTYLEPAHWTIRYAQFDTDIIQRSEEHKVMLFNNTVFCYHHQLPEINAGAHLAREEAQKIAIDTIIKEFNIDPTQLIEISAEQGQLPHRRNWLFIFSHPAAYPLEKGQARIQVLIAGDSVIYTARSIYVPEEWERSEQNKQTLLNIIAIIFYYIMLSFLVFAIFSAFRRRKERLFSKQLFFTLFAFTSLCYCIATINNWATIVGLLNTSAPVTNQLFQSLSLLIIGYLMKAAFFAAAITSVLTYNAYYKKTFSMFTLITGISIGISCAGIISIAKSIIPLNLPLWPDYSTLNGSITMLSSFLNALTTYLQITFMWSLLFIIIDLLTHHWTKHYLLAFISAALCGISINELPSIDMLALWLITGTIIGFILLAFYRYIIRYNYSLIAVATGSYTIMSIIQQGIFNAYPGASFEAIVSICGVSVIALLWHWYTAKHE